MISHEHRCIFIHIPKTGGTSIERVFGHLDGYHGWDEQDHRTLRGVLGPTLQPAAYTSRENVREAVKAVKVRLSKPANPNNRLTVTSRQFEEYVKFTVVRNPWARAYSWYRNVMRDEMQQRAHGVSSDLPFNEFLRRFVGKGGLRPQLWWLVDYRGRVAMDFVARFENLERDFEEVCGRIGAEGTVLAHEQASSGESYQEAYDREARELVAAAYKREAAMFGYTFENGR